VVGEQLEIFVSTPTYRPIVS